MSMIYDFRMISDESDVFVRDYEVKGNMNLREFNDLICNDLKYDNQSLYSFFTADAHWEKIQEFTSENMSAGEDENGPIAMDKVSLDELIQNNHNRLIFTFDMFSDRSYYLELTEVKEAKSGFKYPRVMFAHGEPADQFDPDMNIEELSIFEEAMSDFGEIEGNDYCDDEY